MTRFPLLLLSILGVGALAVSAQSAEPAKPPPKQNPAQFGDQPGLNGQDMTPPRVTGEIQEGTGIRHRQQPERTGQSPVGGHVQQGTTVERPRDRPRRRRR